MPPPYENISAPVFASKTEADRHFLQMAFAERARSDDPKAQRMPQSAVGAVIVNRGEILAQSANVLPPAVKERRSDAIELVSDDERYFVIEHAERAAIYTAFLAGHDMKGSTIYCTRFPCSDCARAIVWAGIRRAVFASGYSEELRWIDSQRAAVRLLRDAGITVRILSGSSRQSGS